MPRIYQAPPINRTLLVGLVVLALVSLVLQIAGLSTIGWAILFYESSSPFFSSSIKISIGLWSTETCDEGICKSEDTKDYFAKTPFDDEFAESTKEHLDGYRAETILGVIFMFVAISLIVFLLCRVKKVKILLFVIFGCSAISALVAAIAAGKFGKEQADSHDRLGDVSPYLIPYSVILTGFGAVLAAIVSVIALIAAVIVCNNNGRQQQQPVAMTTNPHLG